MDFSVLFLNMKNSISKISALKSFFRSFNSGGSNRWSSVVGLEIHAQIQSDSKIFSRSSTDFSSPVNTNVAFFDASIPGTLPVLNKRCVEAGVLTALSLNCNINLVSTFDRKHYFYGDMPNGYQITQQRNPLASGGSIRFFVFSPGKNQKPYVKEVKIKQLQLEQDSGKSLHCDTHSLVDLNRAGAGLMEVVFEPDLTDGEEAAALVKELSIILKRIKTCSCRMEEGALRIDANVSVNLPGTPLGTRTEIKNIGSVRNVASAVSYEIRRQINLKENGGEVINETRSWDAVGKKTVPMRDKEEKQDYRYMPEPNLPPLYLQNGSNLGGRTVDVAQLRKIVPELPAQTRERLKSDFGLTMDQAIILVNDESLVQLFEGCLMVKKISPKLLANVIIYEFLSVLNNVPMKLDDFSNFTEFIANSVYMLETREINRETIKFLVAELLNGTTKSVEQIVSEKNLYQINDEKILTKICEKILNENGDLVKLYQKGKVKVYRAIIRKVGEETNQLADMAKCDLILKELLKQKY